MKIYPSEIPDVLVIEPDVFADERGFFLESWHARKFRDEGLDVQFVQDNHSRSSRGVLRGLHYQLTRPQGKLVRVVTGAVFDVAVDIRVGSPTFGRWVGMEISAENHRQLYIPPGFAHGFCVLSDVADFLYRCTEFYAPEDEYGIRWDDPEIGVVWPGDNFIVSDRDSKNGPLASMGDALPRYR